MLRKEDRKAAKKDRNGSFGKEPRILEFIDKNEQSRRKGKKEKKIEQQVKNKLWKIKHQSNSLEFQEEDLNPRHTEYYQTQLPFLVTEWKAFTSVMRQPLPATFRISSRCDPLLIKLLDDELLQITESTQHHFVENNGHIVNGAVVQRVKYSPSDSSIWQAQVDNRFLAQCEALNDLYRFIGNETISGNIVRQEIVSMLPALLLQPQSHHRVLDVCSAPGSKTEQLLSLMSSSTSSEMEDKRGFLLANDADPKRLDSLRRRFHLSRDARLALICSDATQLTQKLTDRNDQKLQFDRILCDVPCSGDGTFRKCPHLFRLFRPRYGLELHGVQLRILIEALQMLKVNGRLAYSTCSLNPIEDEAVVAAALRHFLLMKNNTFKIRLVAETHTVLTETLLPGFKMRRGETQWRGDEEVFCLGDTDERQETLKRIKNIVNQLPFHSQSLHPPFHSEHFHNIQRSNESNCELGAYRSTETVESSVREQLPYCLRVVPHDQDTGGFFVALFERYEENNSSRIRESDKFSSNNAMDIDETAINPVNDTNNDNTAVLHSTTEEGEDAHGTMKGLGYNPKDVSSVLRRLQQSNLSLVLTHKNNHSIQRNSNNKDAIEIRNQLEDMVGVVFPDNAVVSIHLPLTNYPKTMHRNEKVTLPQSHSVNSLILASQLQTQSNNNQNNCAGDEIVSKLQLTIPEHLKEAFCFCALPVRIIDNKNNAQEVQDIFLIQRQLAGVLSELSVSNQNKAIVYDAAFRIGRFQTFSKTKDAHLDVEVLIVEDEIAMFSAQMDNEDDDGVHSSANNFNKNNNMNNNLLSIQKTLKGLLSFGIELFSNLSVLCEVAVTGPMMSQLRNVFEKHSNNNDLVRVVLRKVPLDESSDNVEILFLKGGRLALMGEFSCEVVNRIRNEQLPFFMLNLQLAIDGNASQHFAKGNVTKSMVSDNTINVDGARGKKRMSKAAKRNAKKLEMINTNENQLNEHCENKCESFTNSEKYCLKVIIFRDFCEESNDILSNGFVIGTNCLC